MTKPPATVPIEPPNVPDMVCQAETIPRFAGSRPSAMIAKPAGPQPAQVIPPNARAAMSTQMLGAKPQSG